MCVKILADKFGFDPVVAMAALTRDAVAEAPTSKKAAVATKKATAAAKKVANADKPKRAPTGYLMFCKAERPCIKKDVPDLSPQSIIKELAIRWKTVLTETERAKWNEHAKTEAEADVVPPNAKSTKVIKPTAVREEAESESDDADSDNDSVDVEDNEWVKPK